MAYSAIRAAIIARDLAPGSRLENVKFMLAGDGEGKMGQARFDRAALVAVLGEITNRRAAMAEIFQALRPGGLLSVTEVALDPHRQSGDEIRRLAQTTGFVELASFDNRLLLTINLLTAILILEHLHDRKCLLEKAFAGGGDCGT